MDRNVYRVRRKGYTAGVGALNTTLMKARTDRNTAKERMMSG